MKNETQIASVASLMAELCNKLKLDIENTLSEVLDEEANDIEY